MKPIKDLMAVKSIREFVETISPVMINPTTTSITVGLSKRFLLFQMLRQMARRIEEDPYLNFISVLKNYKVLGRFLHGTIRELHRDRNKSYFKNFFSENELYEIVKKDIKWVYEKNKDVKLTITKKGIIIYDNYKKNSFNILLITSHSGTWLPKNIKSNLKISDQFRYFEEDINTDRIYGNLVLEKAGIWIDNKMSRFACDFNRRPSRAVYDNNSETSWTVEKLWKKNLTDKERNELEDTYRDFYLTLTKLLDTYRFNMIFDAHSMKNIEGRPQISFGIDYIPKFYLPIVRSMQRKLKNIGYDSVKVNCPFEGGYILKWLSTMFPDIFIFSMEINKSVYMTNDMKKVVQKAQDKVSEDLLKMFDIGDDEYE